MMQTPLNVFFYLKHLDIGVISKKKKKSFDKSKSETLHIRFLSHLNLFSLFSKTTSLLRNLHVLKIRFYSNVSVLFFYMYVYLWFKYH